MFEIKRRNWAANRYINSKIFASIAALMLVLSGIVSQAQTKIKADIYQGAGNSFPFNLTEYGGTLIFNARDSLKGFELWSIDSTETLSLMNDIYTGLKSSFPYDIFLHSGNLFFSANDGAHGHELWKFNGTNSTMVADIAADSGSSWPDNFVSFNGSLFFTATDSAHGCELWKYDGTTATLVSDIYPDTNSSFPNDLTVYNGALYFSATNATNGCELWKYNGTVATMVTDINPGPAGGYPNGFYEYKGNLIFSASNGSAGYELWKHNGTTSVMVNDINTGSASSFPHYFTLFNNDLIFSAINGTKGSEIWKYDGTSVTFVSDVNPGNNSAYPADFTLFLDELYFSADDGSHGFELWKLDTAGNTQLVADILPGDGSFPVNLTVYAGELYFRAYDDAKGAELWSYKPCNAADTAQLTATDTLICRQVPVTITVTNATELNDASIWMLYKDSVGGQPLDSSVSGTFTVSPAATTTYFVRGEGCYLPGEAGSIKVTMFATYLDSTTATICEGDNFVFGGSSLTNAGIYTHVFQSADNCDSTVTLTLNVNPIQRDTVYAQICNGESMTFNGSVLTLAGFYTAVYQNAVGCDSIEVLQLTLLPSYNQSVSASFCTGQSYQFGSQTLTTPGTYTEIFQSAGMCDSIVTLTLTALPVYTNTIFDTICSGVTYNFGSQSLTSAGTYTEVFQSANTCDSTVTLHLVVLYASNTVINDTICNGASYLFEGQNLTASGTYSVSYPLTNFCDSTITLHLTVLPTYNQNISASICNGDNYQLGSQLLTAAGTYTELFQTAGGCDSIVQLTLSVKPTYNLTISDTICDGSVYTLGTQNLTTTGTYTEVFQSAVQCDSVVTLNLKVIHATSDTIVASICAGTTYAFEGQNLNASGVYTVSYPLSNQCDSVITLILSVLPTYSHTANASICAGQSLQFGSQTLTSAGTYTETFQTAGGCDSIVQLTLNVNPVYNHTISATICSNQNYILGTQTLTTAGTYTETFQSVNGCDSVVTLNLTVNPTASRTIAATICNGDAYFLKDQWFSSFGTYTKVFQTAQGCDSTVTLHLNVLPKYNKTINVSICDGGFYIFGTQVLTAAGTYRDTLQANNGCDSIVKLVLTVNPVFNNVINATICSNESYTFGTQTLTAPGTFVHTFQTAKGCDSLVTLHLLVNPAYNVFDTTSVCNGTLYNFGTQVLSASGNYTEVFQSALGCDSTVNLNFTVYPTYSDTLSATICNGDIYQLGTQSLTTTGIYTEVFQSINGCDSVVTVDLLVNPVYNQSVFIETCDGDTIAFGSQLLTTTGIYSEVFQTTKGCDSTITLTLTVHPNYDHSVSDAICDGQVYTLGSQSLTIPGTYTEVFQSKDGCDSTVHLTLTVYPTYVVADTVIGCDGTLYHFGTQTLTTSGRFTEVFPTIHGCDSMVNLVYYVYPVYQDTVNTSICQGDTFILGTQLLTQTGTYTEVFQSVKGCDSVEVVNLTVYPSYTKHKSAVICGGSVYSFGNLVLDTEGAYTINFPSVHGCDSVVTLLLEVKIIDNTVTQHGNELTANVEGATYQWYRLESVYVPIAGATQQTLIAAIAGNYMVKVTDGFCSVFSDSLFVKSVGIGSLANGDEIKLYPNPNNGRFTIELPGEMNDKAIQVAVYNTAGEIVMQREINGEHGEYFVDAESLPKGIYLLRLQQEGRILHKKLIIR